MEINNFLESQDFQLTESRGVSIWRRPGNYRAFIYYVSERPESMRIFNDHQRHKGLVNDVEDLRNIMSNLDMLRDE